MKGNDILNNSEIHINLPNPNGAKFISASETYSGQSGKINEFGNTYIKFDTHHTRDGDHYFNLTLEKNGVYQDVSYSCYQDWRYIPPFVLDPYIDRCSSLTWGEAYKK